MDFARKQLEKYGWVEGKGLGKNENGIVKALKPKLKRNATGVGHDAGADFTDQWWTDLYNKAATNIQVEEKNGETKKIKAVNSSDFVITNNTWHLKKIKKDRKTNTDEKKYGDYFIKTELLDGGTAKVKKIRTSESESEDEKKDIHKITDDELFAACEGRTVHKGARHGLKALGKLARVEQQEKFLLSQPKYEAYSHTIIKKNRITNNPESNCNNLGEALVREDQEIYVNEVAICNKEVQICDSAEVKNDSNIEHLFGKETESVFKIKKKKKKLKDKESTKFDVNSKNDNVKMGKHGKKIKDSDNTDNAVNVKYEKCNLENIDDLDMDESKATKFNVHSNVNTSVMNAQNESELVLEQRCNDINKRKKRKKRNISDVHLQNPEMSDENLNNFLNEMEDIDEIHHESTTVPTNAPCVDEGKNSIKKKKKKKKS